MLITKVILKDKLRPVRYCLTFATTQRVVRPLHHSRHNPSLLPVHAIQPKVYVTCSTTDSSLGLLSTIQNRVRACHQLLQQKSILYTLHTTGWCTSLATTNVKRIKTYSQPASPSFSPKSFTKIYRPTLHN